jgi:hypothetical protein
MVPHGGADAVGAGVATADDNNVLAFGVDKSAVFLAVQRLLVLA